MKFLQILLLFFLINSHLYAQKKGSYEIMGIILSKSNNMPVEYATVSIYNLSDSSLVTGIITDNKGLFLINNIPKDKYFIEISAIGFKKLIVKELNFALTSKINLGKLYIEINVEMLNEVVVTGSTKLIELHANKRVVNIDKSIAVSGGSAADALLIVPDIKVENRHISLKNQSFKILLNGRPSGMRPEQLFDIPASNIKKIEIITNPSVKYSPEGLGGIINIILIKPKQGMNGLVQASGGSDNCYNTAGTINFNKGKFNLFATGNMNYYGGFSDGYLDRTVYNSSKLYQGFSNNQSFFRYNLKTGFDYDIDSLNLITFFWSQPNDFGTNDNKIQTQDNQNNTDILLSQSTVINKTDMRLNDFSFSYQHLFKRENTKLSLDVLQSFYSNNIEYDEFTEGITNSNEKFRFKHSPLEQSTTTDFQLNFVYMLTEKIQIETGLNTILNKEKNVNSGATYNFISNEWIDSTTIKNTFIYDENVYGNYFLFSYGHKKLNFILGIRAEYTQTDGSLENTENKEVNKYFDFFPSSSISYSFNDIYDISVNYSRRIDRPYAFQLNPFIYQGDFTSEQIVGNPYLSPAYNNSFEFDFSQNWEKFSLNTNVSYVYGNDIIDKIFYLSDDNINVKTWDNIAVTNEYSANISIYWKTAKWCKMYLSGSYYKSIYNNNLTEIKDYNNYNIRYTLRFYFKKNWNINLLTLYYSPTYYYASKVEGGFRFYVSATKKISKKLYFSIKLNDLSNQKYIYYSWGDSFYSKSYTDYHKSSVYIGFMYKFGGNIKNKSGTYLNTKLKMNRN